LEQFHKGSSKDGLHPYCKPCNISQRMAAYHRDPSIQRNRSKKDKADNKLKLLSYLLEHPCVDCGESDPIVLDFDHSRGVKRECIARMLSCAWSTIVLEIEKCDVVCANCHRRRTAKRHGRWMKSKSG